VKLQFAVLLLSRAVGAALQALLFALLARSVSPGTFGVTMATTGVVGLVLIVTGGGMAGLLSPARAREDHAVVRGALRLTLRSAVLSGIVLALVLGVAAAVGPLPAALVPIALALTVERSTDAILGVHIADGNMRSATWPLLLRRVVAVALLVAGLLAGIDGLWAYAGAALVGAVVAELGARRTVRVAGGSDAAPTRDLLRQGAPYLVNTLAAQSRMLDTAIVAVLLAPAAAGLYAAASKLVQPTMLIPQTIASLVLPKATRLGRDRAGSLVRPMVLASAASFAVVLPLMLVAEPLVVLVMGEQYTGAGPTLRWLLVGMPFIALSAPLAAILQGSGRERVAALNGVAFAVVLLVCLVAGALLGGTEGAAIGLSVSFVVRVVALAVSVRRTG
jgi:O-antigen/teichoic acid export membrane protein